MHLATPKSFLCQGPVIWSYAKVHNNLVSKANMSDRDLATKLNDFMEKMTKLSVVIKASIGEKSDLGDNNPLGELFNLKQ